MKKLIAMLNLVTLPISATTSLISCSNEKAVNKQHKKQHNTKKEQNDNEKDENNNNEEVIEKMLEKLQNLKFTARLKANKTNTIADLILEVNARKEIKTIVKDYEFTVTSEEESSSILMQQMYQFKITIDNDQQDEKKTQQTSAVLEVSVKEVDIDQVQENNMALLNQVSEVVGKQLTTYNFIADKLNTYKDVKDKIKTDLIDLALAKDVILQIEFINSIFKDDNELIYKSENPFEIKIDLIAKEDNEFSLSKTYNSISIIGFTKQELETIKNSEEKYETDKILLTNLINDQHFKDRLSTLTDIKADENNTVKDLVDKLRNISSASMFESEQLKKYKYGFNSLEINNDQVLEADKPVNIKIFAIDENSSSATPFFEQDFELKIIAETSAEKFDRIANKIKKQLDNVENKFDFSEYKELQADGTLTWNQLFNKFANKDEFKKYFNIANLINIDKDIRFVDFSFSVDETENFTEQDILFSSEDNYFTLNLKMSPADKNIDIKNAISTKINVKIAGLTQEVFDENEFIRVTTLIKDQIDKTLNYDLTIFDELQADGKITWNQLINKFANKNKFGQYFNIEGLTDQDLELVNFSFVIDENETIKGNNIALNSKENYVAFNLKMSPANKNVDSSKAVSTKLNAKIGGVNQEQFDENEFIRVTTLIKDQIDKTLNYDLTKFDELQADGKMTWNQLLNKFANKDKFRQYFDIKGLTDQDLELVNFSFVIDENETISGNNIALNSKENYIALNLKMSPTNGNVDSSKAVSTKVNVKIGGLTQEQFDENEFIRVTNYIKEKLADSSHDLSNFEELQADGEMTWDQLLNKFANKDKFRQYFGIENLSNEDMNLVNFSFTIDESETLSEGNIALNSENKYITLSLKMSPTSKNVDSSKAVSTKVNVKISGSNKEEVLEAIAEKVWTKINAILDKYNKIAEREYIEKDTLYIKDKINDELQNIKSEIPELQDQQLKQLYNGIWKIKITNTNNEFNDNTLLFHEQHLNWNINLSFIDFNTDESVYDKDLGFESNIDWTEYEKEFFNKIDNSFNNVMKKIKHILENEKGEELLFTYCKNILKHWKDDPNLENFDNQHNLLLFIDAVTDIDFMKQLFENINYVKKIFPETLLAVSFADGNTSFRISLGKFSSAYASGLIIVAQLYPINPSSLANDQLSQLELEVVDIFTSFFGVIKYFINTKFGK